MRQTIPCLMLALAISVAGCATPPSSAGKPTDEAIVLTLTQEGTLLLNGKATALEHLAKRLRAAGATAETSLTINIPAETPLSSLSTITSRLASAGYRKILFKRPKHTAVSTQTDRPVTPAPAPQKP
jgi:biopolymer transport protein ExbD